MERKRKRNWFLVAEVNRHRFCQFKTFNPRIKASVCRCCLSEKFLILKIRFQKVTLSLFVFLAVWSEFNCWLSIKESPGDLLQVKMSFSGRVLVYGGKGALGSACVQHFKSKNWVSSSCSFEASKAFKPVQLLKRATFLNLLICWRIVNDDHQAKVCLTKKT